jgi:hypothetical protein
MLNIKISVRNENSLSNVAPIFSDNVVNFKDVVGVTYNCGGTITISMEFNKATITNLALRIGQIEAFAQQFDCEVIDGLN